MIVCIEINEFNYKRIMSSLIKIKALTKFMGLIKVAKNMPEKLIINQCTVKIANKIGIPIIRKSLKDCVNIAHINLERENYNMKIEFEIDEIDYSQIFMLVERIFSDSKNIFLRAMIPVIIETVNSVISDEQKNEILSKVINEIPIEDKQEIINEVLKMINKKCETDLSINIKECRIIL